MMTRTLELIPCDELALQAEDPLVFYPLPTQTSISTNPRLSVTERVSLTRLVLFLERTQPRSLRLLNHTQTPSFHPYRTFTDPSHPCPTNLCCPASHIQIRHGFRTRSDGGQRFHLGRHRSWSWHAYSLPGRSKGRRVTKPHE
jgi:hypothetical protein